MYTIKKGNKARYDGVILTNKEYDNYKKLLTRLEVFNAQIDHYNNVFR